MAAESPTVSCYKGRYHRTCGKHRRPDGALAPKKFLLGTDENEAKRRVAGILEIWDSVERLWEQRRQEEETLKKHHVEGFAGQVNRITGEVSDVESASEPVWDDEALMIAEAIRKGRRYLVVQPQMLRVGEDEFLAPEETLRNLDQLRSDYPSFEFRIDEQVLLKCNAAVTDQLTSTVDEVKATRDIVGVSMPVGDEVMLYAAFDDYDNFVRDRYSKNGQVTPNGEVILSGTKRLHNCHDDIPLSKLDSAAIKAMTKYWIDRPMAKLANGKVSGRRISVETVISMVRYLRRFLNWLAESNEHEWEMDSRAIDRATKLPSRKEMMDVEERKVAASGPDSWTLDELCVLYRYATELERLYLLLGLNAGYAQSEIQHLMKSEIDLDGDPPRIDGVRNKSSKRYGVKLWPETVEALRRHWRNRKPSPGTNDKWAVLSTAGTGLPENYVPPSMRVSV